MDIHIPGTLNLGQSLALEWIPATYFHLKTSEHASDGKQYLQARHGLITCRSESQFHVSDAITGRTRSGTELGAIIRGFELGKTNFMPFTLDCTERETWIEIPAS